MSDNEAEKYELVVPGIGQLVNLQDAQECAQALATIRDWESDFRGVKATLTDAIVDHGRVMGTKTLHMEDGRTASLSGGTETIYDSERIELGLRALGMPEERIREVVEETVTYKVNAVEAKRVAGANEEYAKVIAENSHQVQKPVYVSIRKR